MSAANLEYINAYGDPFTPVLVLLEKKLHESAALKLLCRKLVSFIEDNNVSALQDGEAPAVRVVPGNIQTNLHKTSTGAEFIQVFTIEVVTEDDDPRMLNRLVWILAKLIKSFKGATGQFLGLPYCNLVDCSSITAGVAAEEARETERWAGVMTVTVHMMLDNTDMA